MPEEVYQPFSSVSLVVQAIRTGQTSFQVGFLEPVKLVSGYVFLEPVKPVSRYAFLDPVKPVSRYVFLDPVKPVSR